MKTRILYLLDNLQPDDCEDALARIMNGLSRDRYEIYLLCHKDSDFCNLVHDDVRCLPMDLSKKISMGRIMKLADLIKRNGIGIVHAYGSRADLYARFAKMICRDLLYLSSITAPEEGADTEGARNNGQGFFVRLTNRLVDRFIVSSDMALKRVAEKGGFDPYKTVRIYNCIDEDRFRHSPEDRDRIRAEFNITGDTLLIGAAGRLVWQKGFEFLIKCIPMLIRSHPNAKVLIAGEGPFRERLMMHSRMIGMDDHIILAGHRADIGPILSAVDILVVPSLVDEFSMIALEAMAMAKPVIATRMGGITEQIDDGETGLLVLSWDSNGLAKAINRLIEDRLLAERLGRNAREKVKNDFSSAKMIAETEGLYMSLAEDRGVRTK